MKEIKIGPFRIGESRPPFIIAEAGINHNGELAMAFQMIATAKKSGADAIKFQTFKAEEFVGNVDQTFTYVSQGKQVTESMLQMFKRCEFSREEWFKIKKKCEEEKILFLSTPQNKSDLDLLLDIGVPAIKVGSDDFVNIPLLKSYVQSRLPIILSCGMSTLAEVQDTLMATGSLEGYPTVLMLCTSEYPTPPDHVNILKLKTLAASFPMISLGYSDHTEGSVAACLALALGARVFEKHFTESHDLPGPDHWFSANPSELEDWVDSIKKSFQMLGSPAVEPTVAERAMMTVARRSVVAIKKINKGELLTVENIGLRRPGNGIPPRMYGEIIGHKSTRAISAGELLDPKDFLKGE